MTMEELTAILDIPISVFHSLIRLLDSIQLAPGVTWWSILLTFILLSGILGTFFFIARR